MKANEKQKKNKKKKSAQSIDRQILIKKSIN